MLLFILYMFSEVVRKQKGLTWCFIRKELFSGAASRVAAISFSCGLQSPGLTQCSGGGVSQGKHLQQDMASATQQHLSSGMAGEAQQGARGLCPCHTTVG